MVLFFVQVLTDAAASHWTSPVYRAVVTGAPSSPPFARSNGHTIYAFHGWDSNVFFGDFANFGFTPTAEDLAFQNVLRTQFKSFMLNGQPEEATWKSARTRVAVLDDHVFTVEQYNKARCDFWLNNGFFSYAWIN